MKNKYAIEAEVIQIGMYTDIIFNMIMNHKKISISKALVFSYLIKIDHFRIKNVYTAKNTQDVVYKAISLMNGEYIDFCDNINYILKAMHLLIINEQIDIKDGFLIAKNCEKNISFIYKESNFIKKAIDESKCMSDQQFMKEVISNV